MSLPHWRAGRRLMALAGALALLLGGFAVAVALVAAIGQPVSDVADRAPVTPVARTADEARTGQEAAGLQAPAAAAGLAEAEARSSPADASASQRPPQRREGIRPVRVRIRAIGVDAPVSGLGLNPDGTLEVPDSFDEAGWWTGGARPGGDGPAVVAGHVDSRAGPGVFMRLRDLRQGHVIELEDAGGRVVRFAVDHVEQHPKDGFPTDAVYGDTPDPTLRVITCGGTFNREARSYLDNVIVFASLLD